MARSFVNFNNELSLPLQIPGSDNVKLHIKFNPMYLKRVIIAIDNYFSAL